MATRAAKRIFICLMIGAGFLAFVVSTGFWEFAIGNYWRKHQLREASVYMPCATNLALYCQTFEPFFSSEPFLLPTIDPYALPKCLPTPGRPSAQFDSGRGDRSVRLEIHYPSMFENYGYEMERIEFNPNGTNKWRLRYFTESTTRTLNLVEFGLPASARLSALELLPNAQKHYMEGSTGKRMWGVRFLIMTGNSNASDFIAGAIRDYPNDPQPRMALSLLLAAEGRSDAAISNFAEWVTAHPNSDEVSWLEPLRSSLNPAGQLLKTF